MKFEFLSYDSPFMQFMNRFGRLIILNVLFLLCCIPIVTIGAASTAMYTVTLKQARNEEPYVVRTYFQAFKKNFLQSTLLWIFWLIIIALLYTDFKVMYGRPGFLPSVMRIALYLVILLADMTLSYTFPLQASFYNSMKQTIQNAFLISIRHFTKTIPIVCIPIAGVVIVLLTNFTLYWGLFIWLFIGFAMCAQLKSHYLAQVFDFYINPPEEPVYDEEYDQEYAEMLEQANAEYMAAEVIDTESDSDSDEA